MYLRRQTNNIQIIQITKHKTQQMQNNATSTATQRNPIYASAKLLHSGVLVGALPY